MSCCNPLSTIKHVVGESKTYYGAMAEFCKGRLLTSVVSITSTDSALVITNPQLITVDTNDYDGDGNAITILAYTGVSFTMSGGTAGADTSPFTATLFTKVTTSAGTEIDDSLKVAVRTGP